MSLELCSESSYQSMRRWAGLPLVKCGASKIQIYLRKLTQSQVTLIGNQFEEDTCQHKHIDQICQFAPYIVLTYLIVTYRAQPSSLLTRIKSNSHLPVGLCQGRNHPNKVTAGWRDLLWMPGTSYTWVGVSPQPAISHSKAPTRRER